MLKLVRKAFHKFLYPSEDVVQVIAEEKESGIYKLDSWNKSDTMYVKDLVYVGIGIACFMAFWSYFAIKFLDS